MDATAILIEIPKVVLFAELGKLGRVARDALPRLTKERDSVIKEVSAAAKKAIQLIESGPSPDKPQPANP